MNIPCCNPCITCAPTAARDGRNPIDPDPLDPNNPFLNLSAAAPDVDYFIGRNYPPPGGPGLNTQWYQSSCVGVCVSSTSQADADACAQRANLSCISNNWPETVPNPDVGTPVPPNFPPQPINIPQPRPLFQNTAQQCGFVCPDGSPFNYTTAAGMFFGLSQAAADQLAAAYACQQATARRLCIGDLDLALACMGAAYSSAVVISALATIVDVDITPGQLPPGVFLSQSMDGVVFSGTPTSTGNFTFTLVAQDSNGSIASRQFTITVEGFVTASPLPTASPGNLYSQTILTSQTVTPMTWAVVSGALPAGITLDVNTGTLIGVPTTVGSYSFTLEYTDVR